MKLASYKDGSRDGQLLVVSNDLDTAHYATGIATRLQQVLDDWNFLSPQLEALSQALNHGKARHAFAFDPRRCTAPLPRAYQWAQAHAYLGQGVPIDADNAVVHPGRSDSFLGPRDATPWPASASGTLPALDFEGQLAVVSGDIGVESDPDAALEGVRLLMLANSLVIRGAAGDHPAKADEPDEVVAIAFAPVAVTPDELGTAWQHGRAHFTLHAHQQGKRIGLCDTARGMRWHFGQLLAQLARHRPVRAGSILGSGTVRDADAAHGWTSIAQRRQHEVAEGGDARAPWLRRGDSLALEVKDRDGRSLFGAIDQTVGAAD